MISLLQDLNRNIFRIRLFNNNNIADWKLDDERIIKTGAANGRPCYHKDAQLRQKIPSRVPRDFAANEG